MSIESHLQSESSKKTHHFKDVAKKLLSNDKEEPKDTRPWKWEEEIGPKEWIGMKNYFNKNINGVFDEIWNGEDADFNSDPLVPDLRNYPLAEIYEDTRLLLKDGLSTNNADWNECINRFVTILLLDPEKAFPLDENSWNFMKTQLNKYIKKLDFIGYFYLAWRMRMLAAYNVELKDWKIIITDKPPIPKLDTEIPKRPTRIKK